MLSTLSPPSLPLCVYPLATIMKVSSTGGPRLSRLCWAEVEAVAVPSVAADGPLTSPLLASEMPALMAHGPSLLRIAMLCLSDCFLNHVSTGYPRNVL